MAPMIISRADARAQGLKRYFTGNPCKRGHVVERQVSNLTCIGCDRDQHRANRPFIDKSKERDRLRAWSAENREKVNARSRAFNATIQRKAYKAAWYLANRERIKAKLKAEPEKYRASNIASAKRWCKANPEKAGECFRLNARRRRALKRGSGGTHTAADLAEILTAQGARCAYCRTSLKLVKKHVDHIQPLSHGGSNGRKNLQFLCAPCNQTKSAKDPINYAQSIGLLL